MEINLLPIKPFQETLHKNMCGAATLKMVLDYYGIEKSENELAVLLGISDELGTNDADLKRAAESFGLSVEIENESSFDEMKFWLDKKVPVIVDWFTRGRRDYDDAQVADGHYSVVVGLDENHIYLQDPEIGDLRKITRDDFLRVWFDFSGAHIKANELIIRQLIAIYK